MTKHLRIPDRVKLAIEREDLEPPLWYAGPLQDYDGDFDAPRNGTGRRSEAELAAPEPRQVRRKPGQRRA